MTDFSLTKGIFNSRHVRSFQTLYKFLLVIDDFWSPGSLPYSIGWFYNSDFSFQTALKGQLEIYSHRQYLMTE